MNLALFYPSALLRFTWSVRTALYPLNVLRSRLQLQKQHTVYRGTFHAFTDIWKTEGFRGLYRGFWVTVPQIGCSFIYSTVYEKLRSILRTDLGVTSVAGISCISGGAASFCSQAIFVPTDIIAQYMMIYNNADKFISGNDKAVIENLRSTEKNRKSLATDVLRAIYKADGIQGFYRGFLASSTVYVPFCLVFWPSYYWFQDVFHVLHPPTMRGLLCDQFFAAILGGVCSTVATNPMELLRIRCQVHRTTYVETISRMWRNEGASIFWKGLPPRLISNSLYSGVVMAGYEIVKRLCVLPEYKDQVKW
ncbi:unnamed protein product [Auanema sp. JU1783]|nr:unnamed protein product [Auanema sp. JU1783]